jgi:peroxiredoxin
MISVAPPIGKYAPDFELPDIHGTVHHLTRYLETWQVIAVVMLSHRCPDVRSCIQELNAIQSEFASQRVMVIGMNANDEEQVPEDSYGQMKAFAETYTIQFPYLRDVTQDVARTFGAETTPQAFLIDNTGKIRYIGALRHSSDPSQPAKPYLREAIAHLLAGEPIAVPITQATGCPIRWRNSSKFA